MRHFLRILLVGAALVAGGALLSAQLTIPEIQFDSAPEPLKFPDNIYMGEAAGVATNSKGDVFVYTRTGNPTITLGTARAVSHGGSRLFQFDRSGKFVREIGQGAYGLLQAQQVRVDRQDNVWIVDQMSTQVIKFDPNGRIQMILSRKPEAMRVPALPLTPLATGLPIVQTVEPPAAAQAPAPSPRRQQAVRCRARASTARAFSVPPTSHGMPPATSTLRTATATPGSPSTSRAASTSSRGDREAGDPASSTSCTALPSTRRGTFTPRTRVTGGCRCSTATERSNGSF